MSTVVRSDRERVRARLEGEFARLSRTLRARDDVEQLWRFGSTVEGELHGGSDLDLLVVQRSDRDPVARAVALREDLAPTVAVDLFVVTPEELAAGGRLLDHVVRHGRRIW